MVQRILAALLIVLGLGGIGLGVASATVWRGADTVVAQAVPSGDAALVVTDPGVLGLVADDVTVTATVPEGQTVTLAVGRDVDVLGWVGADPYDRVTGLSDWETLDVTPGAAATDDAAATDPSAPAADPSAPAEGEAATETTVPALVGPDPAGSDMWVSEVTGQTSVSLRWSTPEAPGRWVLLAAGVGDGATPPTVELTWPREAGTPYLWPGVLGGVVLIGLGVVVLLGARRVKRRVAASRPGRAVSSVASAARSQVSKGGGSGSRRRGTTEPQAVPATPGSDDVPGAPGTDDASAEERQAGAGLWGAVAPAASPFAASPFGGPAEPAPFGGAPEPAPFGGPAEPAPFGGAPEPAPFGSPAEPAPFGGAPDRAPFGSVPEPAPFGGLSPVEPAYGGGVPEPAYGGGVPGPFGAAPQPGPQGPEPGPVPMDAPAAGLRRGRRRLAGGAPQPAPEPSGGFGALGGPPAGAPVADPAAAQLAPQAAPPQAGGPFSLRGRRRPGPGGPGAPGAAQAAGAQQVPAAPVQGYPAPAQGYADPAQGYGAPDPAGGHVVPSAPTGPGTGDQAGAPASDRPLTRRELRMRDQAERRAATGTMPVVPGPEAPAEEAHPQEEGSTGRAAAWRQTWGFSGGDGGER
ncbi:hypothetical protein L1785_04400 [Antribacter sp. KLBMP9083]|uniref:Uncharacterized protein n=1 Tax=Antribacter soli TaxID=2910976 RepID=A0AA41QB60_9MICO|nr:hypothetical protein [Antribacter soli]MCF4120214.1 hypothetical protein [Antribacter soli]